MGDWVSFGRDNGCMHEEQQHDHEYSSSQLDNNSRFTRFQGLYGYLELLYTSLGTWNMAVSLVGKNSSFLRELSTVFVVS